jgi:hypothetical protein
MTRSRLISLRLGGSIAKPVIQRAVDRRETVARMSYNEACLLGFRGGFDEWERLMGAAAAR